MRIGRTDFRKILNGEPNEGRTKTTERLEGLPDPGPPPSNGIEGQQFGKILRGVPVDSTGKGGGR